MSAKGTFSLALILIASLGVFSGVQAASFPRFTSEPQDVLVPQDTSFRVVLLCSPQPYTKVVDVRWQFGVQSVENIPGLSTSRNGSGWMLTIDYQQGSRIPLVGNYACVADYKRLGNLRSRVAWVRQFGEYHYPFMSSFVCATVHLSATMHAEEHSLSQRLSVTCENFLKHKPALFLFINRVDSRNNARARFLLIYVIAMRSAQ